MPRLVLLGAIATIASVTGSAVYGAPLCSGTVQVGGLYFGAIANFEGCDGEEQRVERIAVGAGRTYLAESTVIARPGSVAMVTNVQAAIAPPPGSSPPINRYYGIPTVLDWTVGDETVWADAYARLTIDDFIIHGSGTSTSLDNVLLNLDITGSLNPVLQPSGFTNSGLAGGVVVLKYENIFSGVSTAVNLQGPLTTSFGPYISSGQVNLGTVPVNQPFSVTIEFQLFGSIIAPTGYTAFIGSYGRTISLASGAPVFDLPEGFSASSVGAQVDNNFWEGVPAHIDREPTTLPEPSTAVLLVSGLFVLTATYRRSTK